jgi:hypothetical protein
VDIPVVAGGIIPKADAAKLKEAGVAAVFTPKDYELTAMLAEVAELAGANLQPALAGAPAEALLADAGPRGSRSRGFVHSWADGPAQARSRSGLEDWVAGTICQPYGYRYPPPMARIQTLVQLTDDLVALLDAEAADRGVSRSALIREILRKHVAAHQRGARSTVASSRATSGSRPHGPMRGGTSASWPIRRLPTCFSVSTRRSRQDGRAAW